MAAYAEQHEVVADLLRRGADRDAVNANGQTAVACAVFRQNESLLRLLLDAGADQNAGAHTAVQIAEQFGLHSMRAILDEYAAR